MMSTTARSTIVGVFEKRSDADRAIQTLRDAGFRDDQIGVAMRRDSSLRDNDITSLDEANQAGEQSGQGSHSGTGALTGILTGLGLGALAGLGVLSGVIPVIGPAIAGGTLGIILSNAAAGAGLAGLVGALVGAGIPEEEASYYQGEFEAGRTIVTVTADGRRDEAMSILRRFGAYDVSRRGDTDSRGASVFTSETMGSDTGEVASSDVGVPGVEAPVSSRGAVHTGTSTLGAETSDVRASAARGTESGQHVMELKEEQLHAEKRPVEAGEVSLRKETRTEHQTIDVPVQHEEVIIERKPGHGQPASGDIGVENIAEGQEIHIPVRQEQVEVTKTPVVAEEVSVGKRTVQKTQRVEGEVRKEELHVDKAGDVDVEGTNPSRESR